MTASIKFINKINFSRPLTIALVFSFILITSSSYGQFSKLVAAKEKAIFQIETFTEFGLQEASGTGFFIDKDGMGITALHVLEDARFAFIKDSEGNKFPIEKIIGLSDDADLVQFKVNTNGTEVPFLNCERDLPIKGVDVFTIGNPEGYSNAVSKGIVSSLFKRRGIDVIQTTASISQGSSGGPLMDAKGRVIGVIAYYHTDAQNLNFAYSINNLKMLVRPQSDDPIYAFGKGLYLLNRSADKDHKLTLHTIDKTDTSTTAYFSFSNFSIAFGDGAFIYSNIDDTTLSMFIMDPETGKKLYATATSLGESVESPTKMKIGETVYFKIVFPPIGALSKFDMGEGMKGGNWSFTNIQMPDQPVFSYVELDKVYQDDVQSIILKFNDETFRHALDEILDMQDENGDSEKLYIMEATAHFAMNNPEKAIESVSAALYSNPEQSDYHADLFALNLQLGRKEAALLHINNAIKYNDQYIEYFNMRAEVHFLMENWKMAIDDLTKYIDSGRELSSYLFTMRGEAKARIKDGTACADFAKAKELAESDREWEKINVKARLYCK